VKPARRRRRPRARFGAGVERDKNKGEQVDRERAGVCRLGCFVSGVFGLSANNAPTRARVYAALGARKKKNRRRLCSPPAMSLLPFLTATPSLAPHSAQRQGQRERDAHRERERDRGCVRAGVVRGTEGETNEKKRGGVAAVGDPGRPPLGLSLPDGPRYHFRPQTRARSFRGP
jgi:hypothetical protein